MLERIIIPYGYGQTCNQLFQVSHWIPAAVEANVPLYFPGFRRYAHLFAGTTGGRVPCLPRTAPPLSLCQDALSRFCSLAARVPRLNTVGIALATRLAAMLPGVSTFAWDDSGASGAKDPHEVLALPDVRSHRTLWLQGWLYRSRQLSQHRAMIKEFFAPAPDAAQRVEQFVSGCRQDDVPLVGVHLRRGDYRKWAGGQYLLDDQTVSALLRRICQMQPERPVRFVLVSNEPVDQTRYQGLDTVLGPGDPIGDLYTLAACDYLIGPPSTYTLWASFYGSVPLYHVKDPSSPFSLGDFRVCDESC